jgi:predicted nucleic acid-binding protein
MAVVSNSSPLIALAEIKQLDLLRRLFESVWIPRAVAAEVAPSLPTLPDWIAIRELAQPVPPAVLSRALGLGEREALALTLESRPTYVILDDRPARRVAVELGLPLIGTLGILVMAKQEGLISSIRPQVDALLNSGFFIGHDLYRDLLSDTNELSTGE